MVMQPLVFDDSGGGTLAIDEDVEDGGGAELLFPILSMSNARFIKVVAYFPVVSDGLSGTVPLIYAKVTGITGAADAEDGWFTVKSCNTGTNKISFLNLDGSQPDFTGMGPATITFYTGVISGNDKRFTRVRSYHHSTQSASPAYVIGVGKDTQHVLDVFIPNGNTGTIGLRVKPKSIEFEGVAMDATKAAAVQSVTLDETERALVALDFANPMTATVTAAGAGRTLMGVYVSVSATIVSNGAGAVYYQLDIYRTGATARAGRLVVEWVAAAADESRTGCCSVFIPLNGTASYVVNRIAAINHKPAGLGAGIQINDMARLLGF